MSAGWSMVFRSGRPRRGISLRRWMTWKRFVSTTATDDSSRRHEYILYVLLGCGSILSLIGLIITVLSGIYRGPSYHGVSPLLPVTFLALLLALRWLGSAGRQRAAAYGVIGLFFLAGTYSVARWSIDLPQGQLIYALAIVMSGILLGTRQAIGIAAIICITQVACGILQVHQLVRPDISWTHAGINPYDAVTYGVTLAVMAAVSWLSNREIDRSLQRALESETALADERNNLEVLVTKRTAELEQAQLERTMELERFAEYGRLSTGLLHDIANPITAMSLNLEQLKGERSELVKETQKSLEYLERYIETARRQLQGEERATEFNVHEELQKVGVMLQHKARHDRVGIIFRTQSAGTIYGDASKLCRVMANLIANAIESYEGMPDMRSDRQVIIEATPEADSVALAVQDWGIGISAADLKKVFEPFYTTRQLKSRGTGIGLAVVKRLVERELNGTVRVSSAPNKGTIFTVVLPRSME